MVVLQHFSIPCRSNSSSNFLGWRGNLVEFTSISISLAFGRLPFSLREKVSLVRLAYGSPHSMCKRLAVIHSIPLAARCHSCGGSDVQVALRGYGNGRFCSRYCYGTWLIDLGNFFQGRSIPPQCHFDCGVCLQETGVGIFPPISLAVNVFGVLPSGGNTRCPMGVPRLSDNECIRTRVPLPLPLPQGEFWELDRAIEW